MSDGSIIILIYIHTVLIQVKNVNLSRDKNVHSLVTQSGYLILPSGNVSEINSIVGRQSFTSDSKLMSFIDSTLFVVKSKL